MTDDPFSDILTNAETVVSGGCTASAIAGQIGYTSESAFSNAFKHVTGNAPKQYRTTARLRFR